MALVAHDDAATTTEGTGTASATIAVSTDDLIIVSIGTLYGGTWCTGVGDDVGNTYIIRDHLTSHSGHSLATAYCLKSIGVDAENEITITFNDATNIRKNVVASSWTPDSGDTVTLDDVSSGEFTYEASPWETDSDISTTGTDELVIAALQTSSATITFSNHEIPSGTEASVLADPGYGGTAWYRILTGTLTNEEAEVDPSAGYPYSIEALAFISEAGEEAGTNIKPRIIYLNRKRRTT